MLARRHVAFGIRCAGGEYKPVPSVTVSTESYDKEEGGARPVSYLHDARVT